MSNCEWRPITDACKAHSIDVWAGDELVKAYWTTFDNYTNVHSRCTLDSGEYFYAYHEIEPQPKYYLAVVPPPED